MLQPASPGEHGEQRRKTSLSWELTEKKRRQYENNQIVLFGSLKSGIEGSQKEHVWKGVPAAFNSVGVDNRSPADAYRTFPLQPRPYRK